MYYIKFFFLFLFFSIVLFSSFDGKEEQQITKEMAAKQHAKLKKFKALLFADQDLGEINAAFLSNPESREGSAPKFLSMAWKALEKGDKKKSKKLLFKVLELKDIEVRYKLWSWNALRSLGESPPADIAHKIQGLVIEVPLPLGTDTLAAYRDGSARYINQSGKIIIWDVPNKEIYNLCQNVLNNASLLMISKTSLASRKRPPLSKDTYRITILTFSGNRDIVMPSTRQIPLVMKSGVALMQRLMEEVYKRQGEKNNDR